VRRLSRALSRSRRSEGGSRVVLKVGSASAESKLSAKDDFQRTLYPLSCRPDIALGKTS
jgi:hypothetical protein